MKTLNVKRIVVGIMLVLLTLGFCVVGTGAARPDSMGQPPMNGQRGGFGGQNDFGGRGQFGPSAQEMTDGENSFGGQNDFGGRGQFGPGAQEMTGDESGFGGQNGFGGPGGQRGGFRPMDGDTRQTVEAMEDGETKTALLALLDDVHSAMEALRKADDSSRESAEAAVKAARDALNEALSAAGIETETTPPDMPEGGADMTPPEQPGGNMPEPFNFDELSEEQIENLFQRFQSWLDSKA